jgi:recombination protein RecA
MVPQAELDGEFGDAKMGLHARLMSQGMRKLIGKIKRSNTLLFFINQTRDKIGGMGYGDPKVTTGGNALKFYATQRIKISRTGSNKDGDVAISNNVKVEVKKNKIAPPFKKAEFVIVFGEGICKYLEVIDLATDLKIIQKSGSWYSYGDTKLGQGADAVKEILKDNPELFDELELLVRKKLKS